MTGPSPLMAQGSFHFAPLTASDLRPLGSVRSSVCVAVSVRLKASENRQEPYERRHADGFSELEERSWTPVLEGEPSRDTCYKGTAP